MKVNGFQVIRSAYSPSLRTTFSISAYGFVFKIYLDRHLSLVLFQMKTFRLANTKHTPKHVICYALSYRADSE